MNFVRCKVLKDFPWEWIRRAGDTIEIDVENANLFSELGFLRILAEPNEETPTQ